MPEAKIENLELLLRNHSSELVDYLVIVRTAFNQAALVHYGQNWVSVAPNQLRAFWRGFIEVEAHIFNLEDNPVALRLKELEVLERIAEKIDKIQVNGSLDSILSDLISINNSK